MGNFLPRLLEMSMKESPILAMALICALTESFGAAPVPCTAEGTASPSPENPRERAVLRAFGNGNAPSAAAFPARTLHFSPALSLGDVEFLDYANGFWPYREKVKRAVPALGNVPVPAGSIIRLKMNWEASGDMTRLSCLKPDDIQYLDLMGTRVCDESLKNIERLSGLYAISLRDTDVSDDGVAHLVPLKNLMAVNLVRSDVTGRCFEYLARLPKLEFLSAHSTNISCAGVGRLVALPKLQVLELQTTLIDDSCMPQIGKIATLTQLRLDRTKITDAGIKSIGALKNLILFSADQCAIGDGCVNDLLMLKKLRSLSIERTHITRKAVLKLKEALPLVIMRCGSSPSILERDLAPALLKFTTPGPKRKTDD